MDGLDIDVGAGPTGLFLAGEQMTQGGIQVAHGTAPTGVGGTAIEHWAGAR